MASCRASSECTHRSATAWSCSGVDMIGRVECGTLKGYEGGRVDGSWGDVSTQGYHILRLKRPSIEWHKL